MALKTYKAYSSFSTTVQVGKSSRVRISFTPFSYGGSIYSTANEEIQKALEGSAEYGKYYSLWKTEEVEEVQPVSEAPNEEQTSGNTEGTEAVEEKEVEVAVNDYDEAKDYLIEHYGMTRSSLRSKVSIMEAAEANGIKFVGI